MQEMPVGRAALDALCRLAQRQRLAHPTRGSAEAADLQWHARHDQRETPGTTVVWSDVASPNAAVFTTRFRLGIDLDAICLDDDLVIECRAVAARMLATHTDADVHAAFDADDPDWVAWATDLGFVATDDVLVTTWRDDSPPPAGPLAAGYELTSRAEHPGRPHHMIRRNGEHVAARLASGSLYRPDLDLFVFDPEGDVAAYGLFWADPVTGVGLVEPMRTEDDHQGRGLGRAVLSEGMRRLIAAGCTRLKISYFAGNEPAERLYLGVGFEPSSSSRFLIRPAHAT